jgi:hypothetical protein
MILHHFLSTITTPGTIAAVLPMVVGTTTLLSGKWWLVVAIVEAESLLLLVLLLLALLCLGIVTAVGGRPGPFFSTKRMALLRRRLLVALMA